jgi:uncharacterized protein
MQRLDDGTIAYSATDLVGFLACEHLTNLDRAVLEQLVDKPYRNDAELDLLARRGHAHEQRFLRELEAQGEAATTIHAFEKGVSLQDAAQATAAALRRGDPLIYQATFFDGRWRGHADFLRRVATERPRRLELRGL